MTVSMQQATADDAEPEQPRQPGPGTMPGKSGRGGSLMRFWPLFRQHRPTLVLATLSSLVASSTAIVIPLVVARIIDGPISRHDLASAAGPIALVTLLGLVDALGTWGRRRLMSKPAAAIEITLRAMLFHRLQALPVGVHDGWESGQLLSRAIEDLATVRRFVSFVLPYLIINAVLIVVGYTVLCTLNWRIGLLQLAVGLPLLVAGIRFVRRYSVAARRAQDQAGDLATTAEESVQGIRVLKAFGRSGYFAMRFTTQSQALQGTELAKVRLDATLWSILTALPPLGIVFALGYGGYAVSTGTMTLGSLVASITLAGFLELPIIWTGFLQTELVNTQTAADRYWEIMDLPVGIADPPNPVPLPAPVVGGLRLEQVRFRYSGADNDVLRDVSLTLRPGQTVALVGATGSGKTALLNLIPRLYDIDGGRITLDGVDITRLRVADLRSAVSVAFEEPVLFSASVRENVALGRPGTGDNEIWRVLEVAQAEKFVAELPWGLDTRIGEQGLSLSGGQRQRLALARAVLHAIGGSRVVVLDDPLSALDTETEQRVQDRLREVLAESTTLLVAHRPSTAASADRVALLADGRIVAEGTHRHLLETDSRYRELMGGAQ